MSADPTPRRLRLWAGLIVLAIFLVGAATGAGAVHLFRPGGPMGPPGHGGPPFPPAGAPLPPGLAGLDLTPEQERTARALMEKRRPEMEAILREAFPRFEAIRRQYEADLRPFLTEVQARKLDSQRPPPPPGRDGPGGPPPGGPPAPRP
jgi:uncharacterized membrane protein